MIREIIAGCADRLKSGGWLLLEAGHTQAQAVRALMAATGVLAELETVRDYGGVERVIIGHRCEGPDTNG